MPKAARARGASPPAGTALARTIRECLPNRVRTMGEDGGDVTITETIVMTIVNRIVTLFLTPLPFAGEGSECRAIARHEPGEELILLGAEPHLRSLRLAQRAVKET